MPFGLKYEQEATIGEHKIKLPDCPTDRNEILFIDDDYDHAFWRREQDWPEPFMKFVPHKTIVDQDATKEDENGEFVTASIKDSNIIRETYKKIMRNRLNGVFFRNGNSIEYLTGANWFTLEFCKMYGNSKNSGYGLFYKFQRDVFYLLEYVEKEDWTVGLDLSKAKKTGITQIIDGGFCVERATRCSQYMIGFMSRNEDAAIENNFKLFYYAYNSLPKALKPVTGSTAVKGGAIEFTHASRGKLSKNTNIEVLDTRVFCGSTSEHTFDSHFMSIIHLDEFAKYYQDSKKSPKAVLNGNKAAVKDQDVFRGIIILTGYPPEVDDIGSKEGEEVFNASKLSTKKFGRTESELIAYHIPAYKSLKSFIDKYGDCDERGAMEKIMQNRERVKKDRRAYLAELRQNPNDEEEAFGSGKAGATFDPIRLAELKNHLKEEQRSAPGNLYLSGRLEWEEWKWEVGLKNKRPKGTFCPVKFVPLTKDELERGVEPKIRIYNEIAPNLLNNALKRGKDENGCLIPPEIFRCVLGGDPTSYAMDGELTESSKNAGVVISIPNEKIDRHYGRISTGLIEIEYYHRSELPDEDYEDFLKLIIWTDCLVFMEANAPHVGTMLLQEGLGKFMIVKDKETTNLVIWDRWMGLPQEAEKKYQQFRMTNNGTTERAELDTMVRLWKNYFGITDTEIEKDYGKTIKSERILEQAGKFDPKNTKKFDLMMAGGYAHWAIDVYFDLQLKKYSTAPVDITFEGMMGAFSRT